MFVNMNVATAPNNWSNMCETCHSPPTVGIGNSIHLGDETLLWSGNEFEYFTCLPQLALGSQTEGGKRANPLLNSHRIAALMSFTFCQPMIHLTSGTTCYHSGQRQVMK